MQSYELFFYALIIVVGAGALAWNFSRSRSLLDRWAAENDYQILDSSYRYFFRGPFFWTSSKGQTVYRVTIRDQQGDIHSGWVRCGSWMMGLWSDKTDVRWDEESAV